MDSLAVYATNFPAFVEHVYDHFDIPKSFFLPMLLIKQLHALWVLNQRIFDKKITIEKVYTIIGRHHLQKLINDKKKYFFFVNMANDAIQ